jgi:hypothetical protein
VSNTKKRDYSAPTLARHLLFERGEVTRMIRDGRLPEDSGDHVARCLDEAIECVFLSWLKFKGEKRGKTFDRAKWDRVNWEKKILQGQASEKYAQNYLERAEMVGESKWLEPNDGSEYELELYV